MYSSCALRHSAFYAMTAGQREQNPVGAGVKKVAQVFARQKRGRALGVRKKKS